MSISDNVYRFPTSESRAMKAMADYRAGVADETVGKDKAIRAVIEYGEALLDGRKTRSNIDFKKWVTDNKLDIGKPWDDYRERTAAMSLAKLVNGTLPLTDCTACPNAHPTNIMKWVRKQHPELFESKPRKPRSARKVAPTPQTDSAYESIKAWHELGREIPGKKEFAKLINISHMAVEKAFDRWNREHGKQEALKTSEDQTLAEAEKHFSEKSKLTVADAIRIHKKRLDKMFETKVGEEVRRRINAADDATRKQNADLRKENLQLTLLLRKQAMFTAAQFKEILMTAHPDNSASTQVRARAFDLLRQKEKRLTGEK